MPPISSRRTAAELNLDQAPSARRPAASPAGPASGPAPFRPRRSGVSAGRVVAFLVLLAAIAAGVWSALRPGTPPDAAETPASSDRKALDRAWDELSEENRQAIVSFLLPDQEELEGLFDIVKNADFIRKNAVHAELMPSISFYFVPENDIVNAFSSAKDPVAETETPCIFLFGGWTRMTRVIGAAVAAKSFGTSFGLDPEGRMLELLPKSMNRAMCKLTVEEAFALLRDCGVRPSLFLDRRFLAEAVNIADGDCLACIGHEVGHIAYHHVDGPGDESEETQRNNEREADSFAMSIAREERQYMDGKVEQYMFIGSVYENYVFALMEAEGGTTGDDRHLDHPFSSERLLNLLRSKTELSELYGLSVSIVERALVAAKAPAKR